MKTLIKYIDEALFSSASEFSKADNAYYDDDDFVDLGLSVNWAKCNLGAEKETDYGHYYMWGSTKPNDNDETSWKIGPFNNGNECFDKDYFDSIKNKVCPKRILAPKYDVVTQELGIDCHIPTLKEFEELIIKTNHEYIENYNDTKINGVKFINKNDQNKYIFIPAAGYNYGRKIRENNRSAFIWSSENSPHNIGETAWDLFFTFNNKFAPLTSRNNMFIGFSIRPVCVK